MEIEATRLLLEQSSRTDSNFEATGKKYRISQIKTVEQWSSVLTAK
jgi:hypothetical protein